MLRLKNSSYPVIERVNTSFEDQSDIESDIHNGEDLRFIDFSILLNKNPFINDIKHHSLQSQSTNTHGLQSMASMSGDLDKKELIQKSLFSKFNEHAHEQTQITGLLVTESKLEPKQSETPKKTKKKKAALTEMMSADIAGGRMLKGILKKGDRAKYNTPDCQGFMGLYSTSSFAQNNEDSKKKKKKGLSITQSFDMQEVRKSKAIRRLNSHGWMFGK